MQMPIIERDRSQASRGFTLIEMSIVLVIIGLIVGGILKGQEIVNSAREKQVITQLNAVRTAQNTYIDRHNSYPGDDPKSKYVAFAAANGNGDRFVGPSAGVAATAAATTAALVANSITPANEEASYFIALLGEGLIGNAVLPLATTAITSGKFGIENSSFLPNTAFPQTGLGITSGIHAGDTARDPASKITKGSNWLGIWSAIYSNNGGVSLKQAAHIDNAMDDGIPDTGLVRGDDSKCNQSAAAGYDGGAALAATTDYGNPVCILLINMGPNT